MIRRPLCMLASAFAGGIVVRYLAADSCLGGIAAGAGILLLFQLAAGAERRKKNGAAGISRDLKRGSIKMLFLFLSALLAGCFVMQLAMREAETDSYAARAGEAVRLSGVILSSEPRPSGGQRMVILTEDGSRLLADYYGQWDCEVPEGHAFSGAGTIALPSPARNPGCFDQACYLRGRRIYACIRLEKAEMGPVVSRWRQFFAEKRAMLQTAVAPYLDEQQQAVLAAMLFGDKSMLPEETYAGFQRNGTAHVLAVSGLHVGMLYALYLWLFGRRRTAASCAVLAVLLLSYAALAGFSASVVRAGTMIGIHTVGRVQHARYDMLTGAALSSMLILAVSPYQLLQGGFQLSFLAVLLLAFLQPFFVKRCMPSCLAYLRRKGMTLHAAATAESLLAWLGPLFLMQAGMVPVTAYLFNYISAGAFFANLPLVLLAGAIVPAGILLLMVLLLPCGMLFVPLGGHTLAVLLKLLLFWNRLSYMNGAMTVDAVSPRKWQLFLFYGLAFLFLSEWAQIRISRREWKKIADGIVLLLCITAIVAAVLSDGFEGADAVFVDVGQGDCVHLRCGVGTDLLFDGGGKEDYDVGRKIVRPYLLKNRVRTVDAAFVTHLDTDHFGGIVALCQEGMVDRLILYEGHRGELQQIMEMTGLPKERILFAGPGDVFRFEEITVRCLGPLEESASENEQSLVLLAEASGHRVLITGDIGEETEQKMAVVYEEGSMQADVLQVPHHGSKYSSSDALIRAASPAAAVVQVGANRYGHPAQEVIERYEQDGIAVYRNDLDGAVGIDLAGMKTVTMIPRRVQDADIERDAEK